MRIAYFYLMKNDRDRVRAVVPDHVAYWRELRVPGYLGGPLADRSSGLITFEAHSEEAAHQLIASDPFVRADLLESAWINEWNLDVSDSRPGFRPVRKGPSGQ
jgi:uncharacterized protein YciI